MGLYDLCLALLQSKCQAFQWSCHWSVPKYFEHEIRFCILANTKDCITIHCQKWIIKWICAILKLAEFGFFTISKKPSSPWSAFTWFEYHCFCPSHNFLHSVNRLLAINCIWCCKGYIVSKTRIDNCYLCIFECIANSFPLAKLAVVI